MKRNRAINIINKPNSALFKITFQNGKYKKWDFGNRRIGRPRTNWTEETIKDIWNLTRSRHQHLRHLDFDPENTEMHNIITEYEEA